MILFSGIYESAEESGITLTQQALESQIGGWSVGFISFAVFMFAFSSIVANYYYGETNIEFITGSRRWVTYYRFAVMALILFGSVAALELVWTMADLFMASMAIVNLIAIALLAPVASAVLKDYRRQRDAGQDPVFKASEVISVKNTECWGEERRVK